jgi:hypothetical protein
LNKNDLSEHAQFPNRVALPWVESMLKNQTFKVIVRQLFRQKWNLAENKDKFDGIKINFGFWRTSFSLLNSHRSKCSVQKNFAKHKKVL